MAFWWKKPTWKALSYCQKAPRQPGVPPGNALGKLAYATSEDGIHWENFRYTGQTGDRSTVFYDPFRKKWVYSLRDYWKSRSRRFFETDRFLEANWERESVPCWLARDGADIHNPYTDRKISLYNTDVITYESILLGMFQVWYGPDNVECLKTGIPKHTELIPMYSRDGWHFARPSRESIIKNQEGAWDRGYIQSVTGGLVVKEDELWLYYVGFSGDENTITEDEIDSGMYSGGATGIAVLRRDGFVSVGTQTGGCLLTRCLTVEKAKYLFVNFSGEMTVEVLFEDRVYTSRKIVCDSTKEKVNFDDLDVCRLSGKQFRLRFRLQTGQLYSFWFSREDTGESGGYLGAGAPV